MDERGKNGHYSDQTGHVLRGEHARVQRELGGIPPESISGYQGLSGVRTWFVRRSMRKTQRDGRR